MSMDGVGGGAGADFFAEVAADFFAADLGAGAD